MIPDVSRWHQLASAGGHAGPSSTSSYIHAVEEEFAIASRACRPGAWLGLTCDRSLSVFEELDNGLCVSRNPIPERMKSDLPPTSSMDIGIFKRSEIFFAVARSWDLDVISSRYQVPHEVVVALIKEMAEALILARLVKPNCSVSTLKQCLAIKAHFLWARAAEQEKCCLIVKQLDSLVAAGSWNKLFQLWTDWQVCRSGNFLSLCNPRSAMRVFNLLMESGFSKNSLVISSVEKCTPLDPGILKLNIPKSPPVKPRRGQVDHRLFFVEPGLDAREASAATVSVLGFHWLMLVTGSILVAKGDL